MTSHHPLRAGYITACIVVCIWTGFVIVSRMGGISSLTSYDVIALRYMVAATLLLPFWLRHRHTLLDRRKFILALSGALIYALFIFSGFRHAPANHAGILLPGFMPFAITVIAWLVLREVPSRHRLMGLAVIALGVGCIGAETFSHSGFSFTGDALLLAGSCCWGVYTVFLRKWALPPLETTITVTLIASALYLPVYALFLPKGLAVTPWSDILLQGFYQGVMAAIVQMILYARAVSLLGPTRMGLMMAFIPVTVGLAAVPALGEPLTPLVILGLVFVCAGAWLGSRSAKVPPAPTL